MDLKWAGFVLGAGALACGAIGAALASPAAARAITAGMATAYDSRPAATDGTSARTASAVLAAAGSSAGVAIASAVATAAGSFAAPEIAAADGAPR